MAKLAEAHIQRLCDLADAGKGDETIVKTLAHEFGVAVTRSTVRWHRLKNLAEPEGRTKVAPVPAEPIVTRRGDHVVRRFTKAEDALLLKLEGEGLTSSQIARRLDRKPNSITGRLLTLARHEDRRERARAA